MLFGYFRDEYMFCWLAQYSSLAGAASPQFCAEAAVWYCWLSGSLSTPLCVCVCVAPIPEDGFNLFIYLYA